MPALKTVSTFSISSIFFEGSPLIKTRSACLPGARVPIRSCWPRYKAPFSVAMWMASTGVKPASTRSSISSADRRTREGPPPFPVVDPPSQQQASRFLTKATSKSISSRSSAGHWRVQLHVRPRGQVALRGFRRHRIQSARLQFRSSRDACLKHGQRRSHGHMVRHEIVDHLLHRCSIHILLCPSACSSQSGTHPVSYPPRIR